MILSVALIAAERQNRTDGDRAMFSSFKAPLFLKVRPHRMTQTYSNMMGLSQSRIFLGPRTASPCPTTITLTETTVLPHEVQPWPTAITLTETTVHADIILGISPAANNMLLPLWRKTNTCAAQGRRPTNTNCRHYRQIHQPPLQ